MKNWLYRCAALMTFLSFLAHEFLGSPLMLPPLLTTELTEKVIWFHIFAWHVVSVALVGHAILYFYASVPPGNTPMAVVATLISVGYALLAIGHGIWGNEILLETPAPYAWPVISLVGAVGIWCNKIP